MVTITTSLPESLVEKLSKQAQKMSIPKNKLIENALTLYLEHLNRAEYLKTYKQMSNDVDVVNLAEEGMQDYLRQIENEAG